jgi:hypothetical protein
MFLFGWIGLITIALSYKFEEDRLDSLHPRSLPKNNPDNQSNTDTPE